jgi:hypothetical protein
MNIPEGGAQSATPVARLSLWLRISGTMIFFGSATLEARLIWEQTVWTWERGPQMVGFSLAHGPGAILLVFPLLLPVWTVTVVALTARSKIRKSRIGPGRLVALALAVSLFLVGELPDGFWQRAFISQMAASPRAGDLLMYAAYKGDLGTVRGLVSHGVPVNAVDKSYWKTAMHGAAAKGDLSMLRYLVSQGADINALDRSGDSPLELAISANQAEAARFLTENGAKRIRGDDSQRRKAIDDQVGETIEQLNRSEDADPQLQKDIKRANRDEEIQRSSHKDETQ